MSRGDYVDKPGLRGENPGVDRSRGAAADQAAFQELTERWLATQASVNTRAAYSVDLAKFGQWCAAQHAVPLRADTATVAAFQAAQAAAGQSIATQRRRLSALSSFFQFALDAGLIDANPAGEGRRPPLLDGGVSSTAVLSPELVEAYLASAKALDPRLDALVSLIVFDGLKLGEALALDVADVRGRPPKVTVAVRRRRDGQTTVKLVPRSASAVYRCVDRRIGEPLFTGPRRGGVAHRLTRFGADHLIKKLNTTGEGVSANALRRFHITAHHGTGANLDVVRHRAGLDDVRTVRRYLRPDGPSTDADSADPDRPDPISPP